MRLPVLVALAALTPCALRAEPASDLGSAPLAREEVVRRFREGMELLNRLYWSPTLNIWLDRPGDDLRAHYEGRLNPPWWSSANTIEVMLDFMAATGTSEYEARIAELYQLHREKGRTAPRIVAELKRRGQWKEADEKAYQRRQARAAERAAKPKAEGDGKAHYYSEFRNEYLDDSGWWGITWLKMYDRTKKADYLATARAIHEHMAKNWRPDKDGGVLWCEDPDKQKANAITNSLFLILSARLYERTQEPAFLDWANKTREWQLAQALYDGKGVIDAPKHQGDYWTYNQGTYLGGLVALFQATGESAYLDEAAQVADAVLHRSGIVRTDGVIYEKLGTSGWDPGLFKGVLVRYLGQLRDVLNAKKLHPEVASEIERCLHRSVASMLKHSVDQSGQYTVEWYEGAKDQKCDFNTQTSALCLFVALLREGKSD